MKRKLIYVRRYWAIAVIFFPSIAWSAGYNDPGYMRHYGCDRLESAELKPEHETTWRVGGIQYQPRVFPNDSGGAIITWAEENLPHGESAGPSRAYIQSVDGTGKRLWGPYGISLSSTVFGNGNQLAVSDNAGGAIVAWTEHHYTEICAAQRSGQSQIRAQHFNRNGRRQWMPRGILIDSNARLLFLVGDGMGGVIAGIGRGQDYDSSSDVLVHRIDRAGRKMWSQNGVSVSFPSRKLYAFSASGDGDGGVIIVAKDLVSNYGVVTQRISGDGKNLWSSGVRVNSGSAGTSHPFAQALAVGNAGAVVAWYEYDGLFTRYLDKNGATVWTTPIAMGEYQNLVKIIADGKNGVVIVWRSGDSTHAGYHAQRISNRGEKMWGGSSGNSASIVLGSVSSSWTADAVSDGGGGVIVVWKKPEYANPKGAQSGGRVRAENILLQRINAQGKPAWDTPRVVAEVVTKAPRPGLSIVSDSLSGTIVAWDDGRRGLRVPPLSSEEEAQGLSTDPQSVSDIFAQRITTIGESSWAKGGIPVAPISKPVQDSGEDCADSTSKNGVVVGYAVNVRVEPNTSSTVLAQINAGMPVEILERKAMCENISGSKGRWVLVRVRLGVSLSKEGWIFDSYVHYLQ